MELFKWDNLYSVNNEELDNHHKILFNMLNKLYENCLSTDMPNKLSPIVDGLVSYCFYHFSAEEQYMRNIDYKDFDKHLYEHSFFMRRTLQLQKVINKDDIELKKKLIVFLGKWILHHVMEEDKKIQYNL